MSNLPDGVRPQKVYRYDILVTLWMMTLGSLLALVSALIFLGLPVTVALTWVRAGRIALSRADLVNFAFVWILSALAPVLLMCVPNLFPTIRVSDEYLTTHFYFWEYRIPWEQVRAIKPMGWLSSREALIEVSASSLPWFYAIYGAAYGQLGGRYLPISSHVENYQDLRDEVGQNCPHLHRF